MTVADLKAQIAAEIGVDAQLMTLYFGGHTASDPDQIGSLTGESELTLELHVDDGQQTAETSTSVASESSQMQFMLLHRSLISEFEKHGHVLSPAHLRQVNGTGDLVKLSFALPLAPQAVRERTIRVPFINRDINSEAAADILAITFTTIETGTSLMYKFGRAFILAVILCDDSASAAFWGVLSASFLFQLRHTAAIRKVVDIVSRLFMILAFRFVPEPNPLPGPEYDAGIYVNFDPNAPQTRNREAHRFGSFLNPIIRGIAQVQRGILMLFLSLFPGVLDDWIRGLPDVEVRRANGAPDDAANNQANEEPVPEAAIEAQDDVSNNQINEEPLNEAAIEAQGGVSNNQTIEEPLTEAAIEMHGESKPNTEPLADLVDLIEQAEEIDVPEVRPSEAVAQSDETKSIQELISAAEETASLRPDRDETVTSTE
ncbi:hypothetical protein CANCADRAFT_42347 [Tortispora caseinolytica NRRL Y-17796]|uniref:Ubiquitin-like domain-containing protein n=1 Tax=Tortispora caseinolytica NRRL Y-17796 TaxID=767744 RepID=A0A1E4TJ17_9ASCO|nr:hypothetical protein CANCADRAFT_42347 [Tortispora caseinolytica NRRL Y-17796]